MPTDGRFGTDSAPGSSESASAQESTTSSAAIATDREGSGQPPPPSAPLLGVVDVERLATGETPPEWVEILSDDGACRQAVPPDWIESGIPGQVLSPEIQVTSVLANDTITSWPDHVAHLQATYFTDG